MSDTLTFYDYEFHFTHGEPLFVTVLEGRDEVIRDDQRFDVVIHGETEALVSVDVAKLNGFRRTQRLEQKEVIGEYLREADQIRQDGK